MADNNTLLEKLEGLVARFEEVSTLITDPNVIADQKRYVKLTKEYKDMSDIYEGPQRIYTMSERTGRGKADNDNRIRPRNERNGTRRG